MGNRYKRYCAQLNERVALKLTYDDGELRLQGLDRSGLLVVELRFIDVLLARVTPEGLRLRLLPDLGMEGGFILIDERSELIEWVAEEGLHTRDIRQAKHFIVLPGEEIVDVVSLSDPEVLKSPD